MSKSQEKRFQNDVEYRMARIKHLAAKHGWRLHIEGNKKFEFRNQDDVSLEINYSALEIQTSLTHPRWGNTDLKRSGKLTMKLIETIFSNPRAHMPKQVKSEYQVKIHKGSN